MSEHRHMFWTPTGEMPRCDCGKDILAVFNETEQQLAEARALLIDWLPNEFSLRPGRAAALEKRTRTFLHKQSG